MPVSLNFPTTRAGGRELSRQGTDLAGTGADFEPWNFRVPLFALEVASVTLHYQETLCWVRSHAQARHHLLFSQFWKDSRLPHKHRVPYFRCPGAPRFSHLHI